MTEYVDKSKIKVGDKVKIEFVGLVSLDWQEVTTNSYGEKRVGVDGVFIDTVNVHVTDHEPNFKHLEDAIAKARVNHEVTREALETAENAFKQAKRGDAFNPGSRVRRLDSQGTPYGSIGTVVDTPKHRVYDPNQIWVDWPEYQWDPPVWSHSKSLKEIN